MERDCCMNSYHIAYTLWTDHSNKKNQIAKYLHGYSSCVYLSLQVADETVHALSTFISTIHSGSRK